MGPMRIARRQTNHWTGAGWGHCTLLAANPIVGLGMGGATAHCLPQIQSLDWGWVGPLRIACRQSNHWIGAGWGHCALLAANPIIGLGLDGATAHCLPPIQSLDWGWMGPLRIACRQPNHWIGAGWGHCAVLAADPIIGLGLDGA